jgi:hypothetical protein
MTSSDEQRGRRIYAASRPSSSGASAFPGSSRSPRCANIQHHPMALLLSLLHGCLGVNTSSEGRFAQWDGPPLRK